MSVLHHRLLAALRTSEDGLSEGEMALAAGRWWRRHVAELNHRPGYNICWQMVEGEKRYLLACEPAFTEALSSGEQLGEGEVGLSRLREDQTGDSASVNADLTLFPVGSSHYDIEREAA